MGVREIDRFLEQWQMDARDLHRRIILSPTPRERERWHAIWLLAQGWTASGTAQALEPVSLAVAADAKGCRGGGDLLNDRTCAVRAWQRAKLA